MTIKLLNKKIYGNQYFYPMCPLSDAILKIAKRKTLLHGDVKVLQDSGMDVQIHATNPITGEVRLLSREVE